MPKNKPGPPKNQEDFSSNWKKLQSTLQPTMKRKAEGAEHGHKRRRLEGRTAGSGKQVAKSANGLHGDKKPDVKPAEKNEIWFDDVDEMLLERPASSEHHSQNPLMMDGAVTHATKALAMDCEMVGVGKEGAESILARVSLVNQHGHPIYDKFVKPREKVTDFRTHVSGVRPYNLRDAAEFLVVQKEVSDLLKGRILVGHALHNDLQSVVLDMYCDNLFSRVQTYQNTRKPRDNLCPQYRKALQQLRQLVLDRTIRVLFLDHPRGQMRDTSRYKPFRQLFGGRNPSLKKLTAKLIGVAVQQGEHNSVQDAQAAMRLYMMHRQRWERELTALYKGRKRKPPSKKKKAVSTKKVTFADVNE